jgi:tRNA dimethylallyltransferase
LSNKLIVIQGPTASGKTALAVELALHFKTIVLSADSRQFYQEMAIGTAKPSLAEQKGVKHYFIDSHQIKDQITSAQFEKEALTILENEFKKHGVIILVGGSGMFINALCDGLDDIPSDKDLRDELSDEVKKRWFSSFTK